MKLGCDLALEGGSAAPPGDAEINAAPPPFLPALVAFSEFGRYDLFMGRFAAAAVFFSTSNRWTTPRKRARGPWERKSSRDLALIDFGDRTLYMCHLDRR